MNVYDAMIKLWDVYRELRKAIESMEDCIFDTIPSSVDCPQCGSIDKELIYRKNLHEASIHVCRCKKCGTFYKFVYEVGDDY